MNKIKLFVFALFLGLLISTQVQAASFTLNASEDADFYYDGYPSPFIQNGIVLHTQTGLDDYYRSAKVDTLLKFDLTTNTALQNALLNETVQSAKLYIFNYLVYRNPDTEVFLAESGYTWTEGDEPDPNDPNDRPSHFVTESRPDFDLNNPIGDLNLAPGSSYNYTIDWVNTEVALDLLNIDDVFTLVLSNLNDSTDKNTRSYATFYSSEQQLGLSGEYPYTPYLEIITQQGSPVPEPSSIVLGLLGLSGAMGLRRKRAE